MVGVIPRSIYPHDFEETSLANAVEMARGRIVPTPVVANRRVIAMTQGRSPFSSDVRVHRFRKRPTHREIMRVRDDMLRASWNSYDDVIKSLAAGQFGRNYFTKLTSTAFSVAANWYDLWPVSGFPPAGTINGTANTAQQWTDASTGALPHRGNVSPATKHLLSKWAIGSANTLMLMFYDRVISYDQCAYSITTKTNTNSLTAQRYNSGAPGLQVCVVVCTVNGATANNLTSMIYQNQLGVAGQTMPTTPTVSFIVSGAVPTATLGARVIGPATSGGTVTWGPFLPLAAGDTGVQEVTSYINSAANTGTTTWILMHSLGDIMLPVAAAPFEIDAVYQISELEQIFDGACISMMVFAPATTAVASLAGAVRFGWG